MATLCPISRSTPRDPLTIRVEGGPSIDIAPSESSKGSLGWYFNGKDTIVVDGVECKVMIGINITIIGSKRI